MVRMPIKVVPSSSREGTAGWLGDALKVRVTAPAEQGKANAAAEKLIAALLRVSQGCVRITRGRTSTRKVVEISGLSEAEVHRRLALPAPKRDQR